MARLAIRMPKMSMTMTEGEMGPWQVDVGDVIAAGDVVCEVLTDKVDMEVESTVSGTVVEIVHREGLVPVGDPIAWVEGEDDGGGFGDLLAAPEPETRAAPAVDASAPAADPSVVTAPAHPAPGSEPEPGAAAPEPTPSIRLSDTGPLPAIPRARGLAREHGIDLGTVTPTGPEGLIRVPDVAALVASVPAAQTPIRAYPSAPAGESDPRRATVRKAVARVMEPSANIPQFTVWRELHLDAAAAIRRGVSWTTVLLRAYAAGLRSIPELLDRWEGGQTVASGGPTVALAVATDRGLLVPAFTEPDLVPAAELDAEVKAVVREAQRGKVGPDYLAPANASLSNLGSAGVDRFQALITPPQGSVLALGSIAPRPVAVPGGVGLALTVHAGLTVDHRVADGAHAADLLAAMDRALGNG
ncbi:MAG: dihydrolipoamide acetyltransferase family protein [Propioniciclava sp.]